MSEHRREPKLPWRVEEMSAGTYITHLAIMEGADTVCALTGKISRLNREDFNRIVAAVNAHEALVEACKAARDELWQLGLLTQCDPRREVMNQLKAAITTAEEGEA